VTVLTFMFSTCHDTCPLMAQQIRGALDQLEHDVPVLTVSVDPAHDTPLTAKRFLRRQYIAGRMRVSWGPGRSSRATDHAAEPVRRAAQP
jgi:protein SCO1